MSQPDQPNAPESPGIDRPEPVVVDSVAPRTVTPVAARPVSRTRGGSIALALLLSLVAIAVACYVGWRQWQQQTDVHAFVQEASGLRGRVGTLETRLGGLSDQRAGLEQQLDDGAAVNRSLREELLGQGERIRHLEDAVAKLAQTTLSGHDAMLLDETGSLLRMGAERYKLFHDAPAAAAAYALADQTLAQVNDGAFFSVRQGIQAEREALLKSQTVGQDSALQRLQQLRGDMDTLPLKPLDIPAAGQAEDAWSRIRRALARVVTVQRDNGAPLAVADARFARELAALDLAQAQAALLAHDSQGYAAALKRADTSLASQFDDNASAVQQARETLRQLANQLPAKAPVELGAALTELQNLRAVHALAPASAASTALPAAPAPASTAARKDGTRS